MKNILDLNPARTLISPSLLAADFSDLAGELKRIELGSADLLHLDIMDGHFVPNLSFGPGLLQSIRPKTGLLFDTHLMISHPRQYAAAFAKAGADHLTFHLECDDPVPETIRSIRETGCTVGISLKPATPAEAVFPYLEALALVLVMTVEPGFGGQKFMVQQMEKVKKLRQEIDRRKLSCHLEVDGGVDAVTAPVCRAAGANVLVAGTAVFRHPSGAAEAIAKLKA